MQSLAVVRRQAAALRVDTEARRFSGWTELRVAAPPAATSGGTTLGLHCYALTVQAVTVNGVPAHFELQAPVREDLPDSVPLADASPAQQAAVTAEYCFYLYERQLQRERQPELLITLPHPLPPTPVEGGAQAGAKAAGGSRASGKAAAEVVVRIEYSGGGGGGGAGLRFWQQFAATDNHVRRASGWLPCVDTPSASLALHLELTCRADQVAVGPGQLRRQSWADAGRRWRTFHYALPLACPPCQLGFAIGPLQAEAAAHAGHKTTAAAVGAGGGTPPADLPAALQLTHFAPRQLPPELAVAAVLAAPPALGGEGGSGGSGANRKASSGSAGAASPLSRSAHFFGLVFSLFEEVVGERFPLPAMQQVFLPPELLASEAHVAAGLQVLPTSHLIQPRAIEQSIAARCAMARCLARQWFGVLIRAATPLDEWLIEGLSGWLEEQYVRRYMGRNELAYRRWRERQAIFLADNGEAPPLAARGVPSSSPWGPLYGTERLDPSRLWATKATAVVAMLEKRAGEDLFRKHVATVVHSGLAALAAEQAAAGGGSAGSGGGTAVSGGAAAPSPPAAVSGEPGAAAAASPGVSPLKLVVVTGGGAGGGGAGGDAAPPSRLIDTMTFLNDLGRAGSFRKEMAPFAARWVYGRGVPRIEAAYVYHARLGALELALKQTGSESAKRAADITQRAAVTEGSNAGIVKAVVRETEGDQYVDHPVHLGGEAFVLAELKVTPLQEKKAPGGRRAGGKRKAGEEAVVEEEAAPEEPVRWVRLDPGGELLCDIRLHQAPHMLAAQLLHSRDVVAQAEAVQRLAELRVVHDGLRVPVGLEALQKTLRDKAVFYRVRCDAAMALAGLRDDEGQPAGLPVLLSFYKEAFFHPGTDVPRTVACADPSEYFVAQAVVTAVSLCREADGSTPFDALLFLPSCLTEYSAAAGAPFSDYGLVAALCASLGNVRFEGFGGNLLTLLERFLERDAVLLSPGSAIGSACLLAMAALCANGTCDEEEAERVATAIRRVHKSPGLAVSLRHAALAAGLQLAAAQRGPAAALQLAMAGVGSSGVGAAALGGGSGDGGSGPPAVLLALPSAAAPALLLEEAAALMGGANAEAAQQAAATAALLGDGGAQPGVAAPLPVLRQLAALLNAGADCRLRHMAFVLLQLLAAQPATLYRPPPNEAEDAAAFLSTAGGAPAAGLPAASVGATHRTGQASHGTAAAAAAAAAPKIRLQLPGGRPAPSMGGSQQPAMSVDVPAMSDARMEEAGEAVDQAPPHHLFSPVHPSAAAEAAVSNFAGFDVGAAAAAPQPVVLAAAPLQQQAAAPALSFDVMAAFGSAAAPPLMPEAAAGAAVLPPLQQQQQGTPAAAPAPKLKLKFGSRGAGTAALAVQQQQWQPAAAAPAAGQPPAFDIPAPAAPAAPAPGLKLKLKVKLPTQPQ